MDVGVIVNNGWNKELLNIGGKKPRVALFLSLS